MSETETVKTKVKGGIATRNTDKNPTTRKSNFLLTINTNQKYGKKDDAAYDEDAKALDATVQEMLNDLPAYLHLSDPWTPQFIHDVDVDYVIERGPNNGGLHCHILFKFKHSCKKLQLNYEHIREKITEDLGLNNVYILNKLVRPQGNEYLLDYINKYR